MKTQNILRWIIVRKSPRLHIIFILQVFWILLLIAYFLRCSGEIAPLTEPSTFLYCKIGRECRRIEKVVRWNDSARFERLSFPPLPGLHHHLSGLEGLSYFQSHLSLTLPLAIAIVIITVPKLSSLRQIISYFSISQLQQVHSIWNRISRKIALWCRLCET